MLLNGRETSVAMSKRIACRCYYCYWPLDSCIMLFCHRCIMLLHVTIVSLLLLIALLWCCCCRCCWYGTVVAYGGGDDDYDHDDDNDDDDDYDDYDNDRWLSTSFADMTSQNPLFKSIRKCWNGQHLSASYSPENTPSRMPYVLME